jgi:Protein of unknown function (DUF1822)
MFITPTQWQIEIPDTISKSAWQQSQACPIQRAQWNTYLNQISCDLLLPLLREYLPAASTYPDGIATLWEVVSGTGLQGLAKRFILVPDKSIDRELSVPQEWVDSQEWSGDYYLAVQINPDEQSLTVWGYTTHAMLKAQGEYHADDRTYHLDAEQVIQDLNVLWVTQQVNPQEVTQSAIAPIPSIDTAENLLQRLARSNHPRLEIPFVEWMACLHQSDWRQRLSALRRGETPAKVTHLSQWFQNIFESGWAALENELGNGATFALRQTPTIDAPTIRRVKALRMQDRLLLLMMTVEPTNDGRLEIQVQVRSGDHDILLPLGLVITLQSSAGEAIQTVQALPEDLAVQLQRFRCATGTPFLVNVELGEDRIEELFMV